MSDEKKWVEQVKPKMNSPFPNLPYLNDNGVIVTESAAIFFYLSNKCGREDLFGSNFEEKLSIIQTGGVIKDVASTLQDLIYDPNYNEGLKQKCFKEDGFLEKKLIFLNKFLDGKDFLVGKNVCYIDFLFYESIQLMDKLNSKLFEKYPNFLRHSENFRKLNGIQEYFKSPRFEVSRQFANPLHSISKI